LEWRKNKRGRDREGEYRDREKGKREGEYRDREKGKREGKK